MDMAASKAGENYRFGAGNLLRAWCRWGSSCAWRSVGEAGSGVGARDRPMHRSPPPQPCPTGRKPHSCWCVREHRFRRPPRLHPEQVHLRQGLISHPASLCLRRSPRRVPAPGAPPCSRGGGCMPGDASAEDPLLPPTPLSTQRLQRGCQKPGSRTAAQRLCCWEKRAIRQLLVSSQREAFSAGELGELPAHGPRRRALWRGAAGRRWRVQ